MTASFVVLVLFGDEREDDLVVLDLGFKPNPEELQRPKQEDGRDLGSLGEERGLDDDNTVLLTVEGDVVEFKIV